MCYNIKDMAGNESVLQGKKALVVGGTSSVGLETARALALRGALVTVSGRSWKPIVESDTRIGFCRADFQTGSVADTVESSGLGKLAGETDILVVCYGPFVRKSLHQTSASDWELLALHDYALPGMLVSLSLKGMLGRRFGRIVLFGGTRTDSVRNYSSNAAYAGAKTGISVIIKSVSAEYSESGITCNGLMPGFTRDPPPGTSCVSPGSLAEHALYLMEHGELNGVLLNVDKGWTPGKTTV